MLGPDLVEGLVLHRGAESEGPTVDMFANHMVQEPDPRPSADVVPVVESPNDSPESGVMVD